MFVAYVSSASNISKLETIRTEHLKSTNSQTVPDKAIVWLSYNVHGNESVSTEASMQTIYELLTKKMDYLENTVVIMDPCINPDGRDRYVNWYNENRNSPNNVDPNSKEHNEGWLNGRANHYMFDLNRDWAWLTQVESQQRLKVYNTWLPHIHVDFHEQGVDSPYYFAPAAEPYHEVITNFQRDFQVTIGKNHAKYFDEKIGTGINVPVVTSPVNWKWRVASTSSIEKFNYRCWATEQSVADKAWRPKPHMLINIAVETEPDVWEPRILDTTFNQRHVGLVLIEYAREFGTITDRYYKYSRTGSGASDTNYSLIPLDTSETPKSINDLPMHDLTSVYMTLPYEKQQIYLTTGELGKDNW